MGLPVAFGIVAIGRNEGERLERCLRAAQKTGAPIVYVDSDSSDGSPERARALGADVVELDPSRPLSAARGRNAGLSRLLELSPSLELVQFIDGDCELVEGWLSEALQVLERDAQVAAVCGRRRERFRTATPYNRLIDLEWDTPIGRTDTFGGDVLIRTAILRELGGYDETLIAGEDPELARRISGAGWAIERIDVDMTLHDADLTRFGQWWTRQIRGGHALAEAWHNASKSDKGIRRRVASVVFWAAVLPLLALATLPLGAVLLLGYPVLGLRIYRRMSSRGCEPKDALLYAGSCVLVKFPELYGGILFFIRQLRRVRPTLIEYK